MLQYIHRSEFLLNLVCGIGVPLNMAPGSALCSCCSRSFKNNLMIVCSVCRKSFRHLCVNITVEELRILSDVNKGYDWTCDGCRDLGSEIKDLKALILSLQKDILDLKSLSSAVRDPTNLMQGSNFEELMDEIDQRSRRKGNLILFGVPEQNPTVPVESQMESEKAEVNKILNLINSEVAVPHVNIKRLGTFNGARSRPIKVFLGDENLVRGYIQRSNVLKNLRAYKKVYCSYDRTQRQLNFYKEVKKELLQRQEAGETNIRIKYFRGVPKIVNLN